MEGSRRVLTGGTTSHRVGNLRAVVNTGRLPDLTLTRHGETIAMRSWAEEILARIAPIAALLDRAHVADLHGQSLAQQRAKLADADLTPSARVLAELRTTDGNWNQLALKYSRQHAAYFRGRPLDSAHLKPFLDMAEQSLAAQAELERDDQPPFDDYLAHYFDQYRAL